jgi:hypothetical protein
VINGHLLLVIINDTVTEQHVAGQGLHACTVGVNMKILIWIMWPRILISGGGFSLEESEREIKSAWDAW